MDKIGNLKEKTNDELLRLLEIRLSIVEKVNEAERNISNTVKILLEEAIRDIKTTIYSIKNEIKQLTEEILLRMKAGKMPLHNRGNRVLYYSSDDSVGMPCIVECCRNPNASPPEEYDYNLRNEKDGNTFITVEKRLRRAEKQPD